ncbi:MAG: hypothetical protein GY851_11865 [bacterium]|nr:hypothetical protein [bacterium]
MFTLRAIGLALVLVALTGVRGNAAPSKSEAAEADGDTGNGQVGQVETHEGGMGARFDDRSYMKQRFSDESVRQSYGHLDDLLQFCGRFYEAFMHESNLGDYDPGTNSNPYTFAGAGAEKLPDDATITVSFSKTQFVDLGMPPWESMVLGEINHSRFLKAWMEYQMYENARLRLELMDAKGQTDPDPRKALKDKMSKHKKAVIDFLNTPPAD